LLITLEPFIQISQMRYRWNPWMKTSSWRHLRHLGFSAIWNISKNFKKAFQVTQIVWFPRELTSRIFRPSLMKSIVCTFEYRFCLPVTANQIWRGHAKQEVRPYRCFDIFMPNLVYGLMMPSWVAIGLSAMLLDPPIAACSYIWSTFRCNWSLWQPHERYGKKLRNLAHVFRTVPLPKSRIFVPKIWTL